MQQLFSAKQFYSVFLIVLFSPILIRAQTFDSTFSEGLHWRMIGPYRGGRVKAVAGVPDQPNVFYFAQVNGGIWKTNDYGRTWQPIFDREPTGSIGAIAIAPSNSNIIYAGSGEGLHRPDLSTGDGIYKSIDAGKTWAHLGLRDGQQIPKIAVDPKNPNRLFVAVLGHPYGPNAERGIFRSTDGGKTFEKVLYKDENTGGSDLALDPVHPNIVYAALWEAREGPWENAAWAGDKGGIFKSTDGGNTWNRIGKGLPGNGDSVLQANLAISASNPNLVFASIASPKGGLGIFRSDDAGENWYRITADPRPAARIGGGDLPVLAVDPKNPDVIYSTSIVLWRSANGGKTWTGIRGAPGGDDYQNIWINPQNPGIMLVASDQGAIVTVNGGQSWSSWYNQPTAQLYHVSADNAFPYNVYSGQQESGSVGIASRGNDGEITFREWHPVGAEEYGYVVPDPLDPNIIYGGKLSKYNKLTGQTREIAPVPIRGGKYRFLRTAPLLFSPIDPHTLYFAGNVLFKTRDGGGSWQIISPDLARKSPGIPSSAGIYRTPEMSSMPQRGVIYTLAPSPLDINTLWAGTDDGLIQLTKNGGKTWNNVTPPSISSWNKISLMDAGHFSVNTAYAAVNCLRLDDIRPHIYRTHDGGKTWKEIVNGLPDDPINTVKEDPVRKGLLFAGSETAIYVSFDDGDHWQSLRLNMPATSIRDLMVKNNDLVTATHGRSFWILDDIAPLRQLSGQAIAKDALLYKPDAACRVRWDMNTDTPLPPDEPGGENPPDGAVIDYYLKENTPGTVKLEIFDAGGKLVRHYASKDTMYKIPPVNIPIYWIRPQQILSGNAGFHRFVWDLHYQPLNLPPDYPIAAIYKNTAPAPTSPYVLPGVYTVRLTVNGEEYTQRLTVKMDPRVKTSFPDLKKQLDLSLQCYEGRRRTMEALKELHSFRMQLAGRILSSNEPVTAPLKALDGEADSLETTPAGSHRDSFNSLNNAFAELFNTLQGADMPPTARTTTGVKNAWASLKKIEAKWDNWKNHRYAPQSKR